MKNETPRTDTLIDSTRFKDGRFDGQALADFARKLECELGAAKKALLFFANADSWKRNGPCDGNSGNFRAITVAEEALAKLE